MFEMVPELYVVKHRSGDSLVRFSNYIACIHKQPSRFVLEKAIIKILNNNREMLKEWLKNIYLRKI